ncbi:MAG TPA: KAP family NTPase [Candidatus Mucispirillum faecigallinarum]|uniref:KAP family NTPase n=1 Tax=Candidatus Mucispirillum faecigallinarum TaxID=2838699 RepID=A0A9D2GSA1_9BACT|nr:KAP family NTPase [Candidatus Mucispirillum faecigallinarum]
MPEHNQNKDNITKAFEPDYLNRKALAVEWTDALLPTKLNHHLVISVSGDWGTGKTYLAKNWHKYLEEQGYFTCYIDAHKKDYAEDPLLVFVEELNANINQYYKENMGFWWKVRNKIPVLKNKVPKLLINASTLIAGVEVGLVINVIRILIQLTQNFLSSKIKDKLKYFALYEKYISDFKAALTKFTTLFDKPVVIFIDELDRSNPKFVVKLIEQLKHIFEIPNLAFILTVNKKELSNTIKGIYGSEMDGYAYYKKFTTHDFTLYPIEHIHYYNIKIFIKETIKIYNDFIVYDDFYMFSVDIVQRLNLSLRDIEQIIAHLYYINGKITHKYHKYYLIVCFLYRALYIKYYKLFIYNRINFENIFDEELFLSELSDEKSEYEAKKIISLFKNFTNIFERDFKTINILSIIINGTTKNILENIKMFFPFKEKDILVNKEIFHNDKLYIYYPILIYRYDDSGKAIPCKNLQEMSDNILYIRKNLIQYAMLGAVPKDNIV